MVSLMFVSIAVSEELKQTDTKAHRQNCALYLEYGFYADMLPVMVFMSFMSLLCIMVIKSQV